MNKFKITRFVLFPVIIIADFLQNNFTKYFTPMNLGPVTTKSWSTMINNFFKKKDFVLDYGCGVGFFCKLFNHKKYLGIDINKNFIINAKKINRKYIFASFDSKEIKNYNINSILINNVIHHLSDKQVKDSFRFLRKHSKKKSKILIVEPLLPTNFFSLQFFLKALDIGNYIRSKKQYLKILKREIIIKGSYKRQFGIGTAIIFHGYLRS